MPEVLEVPLVVDAPPVEPVVPEVVCDPVLALPPVPEEEDVELDATEPEVPPLPELPEVAVGLEVAAPEETLPVFPVMMVRTIVQVPEYVTHGANTVTGPSDGRMVMSMSHTPE